MTDTPQAGLVIAARSLTKRFGATTAVHDLTFDVRPGIVTGFLGPNGAGKSTTMRMILGLDRPTSGEVTIGGVPFGQLPAPSLRVGAMLDARAVHRDRTAASHLRWMCQAAGLPTARGAEVLDLVGLADVAGHKAGGFSLGMLQRLGIAAALLGDPDVLVLDEPTNGLDPDGIRWIRTFMHDRAAEGRTVFMSSHLMAEVEQTVDHVVIIREGRLVADLPMAEVTAQGSGSHVRVVTPDPDRLTAAVVTAGGTTSAGPDRALHVVGLDAPQIGELARARGIGLHELTPRPARLEDAFMELTQ